MRRLAPFIPLAPGARLLWLALPPLYLLAAWGRRAGLLHGRTAWHLADVICLPLVLGGVLVVQRLLSGHRALVLPRWHGACAFFLYAIYFEAILPRLVASATGDGIDVLAYACGWLIFELFINRRP